MMAVLITKIAAKDTYSVGHKVLWPDLPLENCILYADDVAQHFGAYQQNQLVGVLSLFPDVDSSVRLRKFAILGEFQGQGIGMSMLQTVLNELVNSNIKSIWCDARTNAVGFYQKLGFEVVADEFFKKQVAYYKMACSIANR